MNEFIYEGFQPDDTMEAEAQAVIEEVYDVASKHVNLAALVRFEGNQYYCSIDAFLRRGCISIATTDSDYSKVLCKAKEILLEKVSKHKETRFFSRPDVLTKQFRNTLQLLKQT